MPPFPSLLHNTKTASLLANHPSNITAICSAATARPIRELSWIETDVATGFLESRMWRGTCEKGLPTAVRGEAMKTTYRLGRRLLPVPQSPPGSERFTHLGYLHRAHRLVTHGLSEAAIVDSPLAHNANRDTDRIATLPVAGEHLLPVLDALTQCPTCAPEPMPMHSRNRVACEGCTSRRPHSCSPAGKALDHEARIALNN